MNGRTSSSSIGQIVTDVDLGALELGEVKTHLQEGLDDCQVLVFRNQSFDSARHTEIMNQVGSVCRISRPGGEDGVMYVSNRPIDGQLAVLREGSMDFHSDLSYTPHPVAATTLFAIEVPVAGGATQFLSAEDAYARLEPTWRRRIAGMRAVHGYNYSLSPGRRTTSDLVSGARAHEHPLVVVHPRKGVPVLYVNRLMTRYVMGVERAESDEILGHLFEVLEEAGTTYEHQWQPGDFVCWDNISVQHARATFSEDEPRILRRISIEGSELVPVA